MEIAQIDRERTNSAVSAIPNSYAIPSNTTPTQTMSSGKTPIQPKIDEVFNKSNEEGARKTYKSSHSVQITPQSSTQNSPVKEDVINCDHVNKSWSGPQLAVSSDTFDCAISTNSENKYLTLKDKRVNIESAVTNTVALNKQDASHSGNNLRSGSVSNLNRTMASIEDENFWSSVRKMATNEEAQYISESLTEEELVCFESYFGKTTPQESEMEMHKVMH